jgi:HD-like signal output (HDOD) protein
MAAFRDRLAKTLEAVDNLPTLPSVVLELESVLRDDESSADDVAEVIGTDMSLASNMLRIVNSVAFMGRAGEITDIRNAVARLGLKEVRNLVYSLAISKSLKDFGKDLDHENFWKHSFVAAVATNTVIGYCKAPIQVEKSEAYLAGLLHDIGILFMDQYFHEEFVNAQEQSISSGVPLEQVERKELDMDHGEVGGALLDTWNIPESIVEAVRWHHQPENAPEDYLTLIRIVHITEFICTCLGIGDAGDGQTRGFDDSSWDALGLNVDDIPKIIKSVEDQVDGCEPLLAGLKG